MPDHAHTPPDRAPTLTVRELALEKLTPRDIESWSALAKNALEPNPFFEPEFVIPAAEHLGERRPSLMIVEAAGDWRACLPVHRVRLGRVVPAVRAWCHLYCFLGTPLIDRDIALPAARSLLDGAVGRGGRPLVLARLGDGGPAFTAIEQAAAELGLDTLFQSSYERAILVRQSGGEHCEGLSGRRRRDLDRLERRLETELGGEVTVVDEAERACAVDAFIALERSGWKGLEGTALASDPRHVAFFREVCESFAARGRLELLTLEGAGRRAAMTCNLYSGEGGFCFKVAHDAELRRFSPGVQLERESMRVFHEQRTEHWQDSCADPENAMINRLWPDRRHITTMVLARHGLPARCLRRAMRVTRTRSVNKRSESAS